jgi:hypothetical protein
LKSAPDGPSSDTVLACLNQLVRATQIQLGTDYPPAHEIGVATTVRDLVHYSGFDDADGRAIESGNALRVFPRPAAAARASLDRRTRSSTTAALRLE